MYPNFNFVTTAKFVITNYHKFSCQCEIIYTVQKGRAGEREREGRLRRLHAALAHELDNVCRRVEGRLAHEAVHLREGRSGEGERELGPPDCLEGERHVVRHSGSCGLGLVGAD